MMKPIAYASLLALATLAAPVRAQTFAVDDPVLERMWALGMDSSRAMDLAQVLTDSIGPRLTGTPGFKASTDWLVATYKSWGVDARAENYGTWKGWRRGVTHLDLVAPRVRTLEAMMLAWSPGTKGRPVQGRVVNLPDFADSAAYAAWLPRARGTFVLISAPQASCRPADNWEEFGQPGSADSTAARRRAQTEAWTARLGRTGYDNRTLPLALERAGAAGILTSTWSGGWGVTRIFNARTATTPTLDLSCEDYGLLWRLAERNQGPVVRLQADAEFLGDVPAANAIATIRGAEKPDEYIVLSAHLDSWDGSSGATDNGTGTTTMLEAIRILRQSYPNPKRTIVVGHWGGEEQGLIGSRSFVADHPEIVRGLHALFNQDNGTGRVRNISMQGLVGAGAAFGKWFARLPAEVTESVNVGNPGMPSGGGSDNASFACHGTPAFGLGSLNWDYFSYTWHTNRDTYDKIVPEDLKRNATLTAMLVYLADQEPEQLGRERRVMPVVQRTGQQAVWPECGTPARAFSEWTR
jgi:hypothetical protein